MRYAAPTPARLPQSEAKPCHCARHAQSIAPEILSPTVRTAPSGRENETSAWPHCEQDRPPANLATRRPILRNVRPAPAAPAGSAPKGLECDADDPASEAATPKDLSGPPPALPPRSHDSWFRQNQTSSPRRTGRQPLWATRD